MKNPMFRTGMGFVSVYQLQMNITQLQDALLEGNPAELIESDDIGEKIETISQSGEAIILIFEDENLIYKSDNITEEAAFKNAEENELFSLTSSQFYTDDKGSMLLNCRLMDNGSYLRVFYGDKLLNNIISETDEGMLNYAYDFMIRVLFPLSVVTLFIILATNLALAYGMSKDLVNPIHNLSLATKRIRAGDLDYEIDYRGGNEIGELSKDFDEMRVELREAKKLEKAYEENRRELIAGISHDLGSPLTRIKGYVLGIMDGIADTPEKREKYLRTIYDTATDMDNLVDQLSLLSKLETKNVAFDFTEIEASKHFSHYTERIEMLTVNTGVKCIVKNYCREGVFVMADVVQMNRIVKNLVENSVKYNKNPEPVVKVELRNTEKSILLSVSDNGPGVPEEELEKIFESFYRTDKARHNSGKSGNGLGLAIVRKIVVGLGGAVKAENNKDGGLKVTVSLPAYRKNGEEK